MGRDAAISPVQFSSFQREKSDADQRKTMLIITNAAF